MDKKEMFETIENMIKKNSSSGKWTMLTIPTLCSQLSIGGMAARIAIIRLRLDVNFRTRLAHAASRFKPKEFFYGSPKEKIKDIKSGTELFDITEEENRRLIKVFNEYLNENDLSMFLILMYIVEKLKTSSLNKRWGAINIIEISKFLGCSESKAINYIDELMDKKIVIRSPYTCKYRLVISDQEYTDAKKEIYKQSTIPDCKPADTDINSSISEEDISFSVTEQLKRSISKIVNYNTRINLVLDTQTKLLDALTEEEERIQKQKIILARLNTEYNKLSNEYEKLKIESCKSKDDLKLTNEFLKDYQRSISDKTVQMIAKITAIVEDYFKQPIRVKNDNVYNNKVKVAITTVMVEYQQELLQYKRGSNKD